MATETLAATQARHPDVMDGELLGEPGVTHPRGGEEKPEDIVDAEIVDEAPADEGLVVTKRPTGTLKHPEAGTIERSFTPTDIEALNHMLAQGALKATLPAPQGSATKLTYSLIDQSHDAKAAARRIAEQKVKEKAAATEEGNAAKRFVKKAWRNFTTPYTYQKARTEALNAIREHGDIYANVETTDEKWESAHEATFGRVTSGIQETLHKDERYESTANDELISGVKDLIRRGANGELSDEALEEEKRRLYQRVRQETGTQELGEGIAEMDNLIHLTQAVRGAAAHGESIEAVLDAMEFKVGEARSGVRQERQPRGFTDRLVDKLHTSRAVGTLLSPEAIGTFGGAIAVMGHFTTSKTISKIAHAGGLATGVVGAAAWAMNRERSHLLAERAHHNEARAEGQEFDDGEKMDDFTYDLVGSDELLASLNFESLDLTTKEGIEEALEQLGHVEARIALTDSENKNLIAYNDTMDVADQRWALDLARAQAKCQLRPLVNNSEMLEKMGFDETMTFDGLLDGRVGAALDVLQEGVTAKDQAFNKWMRKRMLIAGGIAGASSLTFGLISTEVFAAFSDKTTGMFEKFGGQDGQRETILASLAGKLGFGSNGMPIDGAESFADRSFGANGSMTMPEGMEVQNNPDGTVNLSYGDMKVDSVPMEKNGTLSPEALARLHEKGFQVSDLSRATDTLEPKTVDGGTLHDFMQANRNQTEHVTRVGWSDNDTERPDKNELKIWWGGKDNNGIRPGGGFQFDLTQMTAGGSSHDGINENWKELAKKGELKMFISSSANEQTRPFTVSISPDGKVDIPADHPAVKLFSVHDGEARFDGKYAEVAQVTGQNSKGVTEIRPLATEVGNDTAKDKEYTYTEKIKKETFKPAYTVRAVGGDGSALDFHAGPGFAPHSFAKPARARPVDAAPIASGPQGELDTAPARPELGSARVLPELGMVPPRPLESRRAIERSPGRSLEVAGRPEARAIEHRDRVALAAERPRRIWSPFWQGEIGKGETPAIESPAEPQAEEESYASDVEYLQNAAREALRSGQVSVSEMEQIFRNQFGAGGVYVTVLYDHGQPVDYNVRLTDVGIQRLRSMLDVRQILEAPRRPAIEIGPATPELEP